MKNIVLIVEYDGRNFYGYQIQKGLRTVEGELNSAIEKAVDHEIDLISSSRTDKFVHSLYQVVNFYTHRDIPPENYKRLMDFLLPDDITIKDSFEIEKDFHSRFDAYKKTYKYIVYNRKLPNALYSKNSHHCPYYLNLDILNKACEYFIGEKDFSSYTMDLEEKNPIREIYELSWEIYGDFLIFEITANSFLYKMIRIIIGTIIDTARGKFTLEELDIITKSKDRTKSGITLSGHGLYLKRIYYKSPRFR